MGSDELTIKVAMNGVAEDGPFPHDLFAGARGVQVAELAMRSSAEGRRVEVPGP